MLTTEKGGYPLCLFLDTNKWIDLSRANYGRRGGEAFTSVLTAIRSGIEAGKLVVPLAAIQLFEAQKYANEEGRERLLSFMIALSQNYTLIAERLICPIEVTNAVRQLTGRGEITAIRPLLLGKGILEAVGLEVTGGSALRRESITKEVERNETTLKALLGFAHERQVFDDYTRSEQEGLPQLEQIRSRADAALTREQAYALNLVLILSDPTTCGVSLPDLLRLEGIDPLGLQAYLDTHEKRLRFGAAIPTVHVPLTLSLGRERSKLIDLNDTRDLHGLALALPYADVAVIEKGWATVARRCGLDREYQTTVLTQLQDVPQLLRDRGCVS